MLEIAERLESPSHKPTCSPKFGLTSMTDIAEDDCLEEEEEEPIIDVCDTEEVKLQKESCNNINSISTAYSRIYIDFGHFSRLEFTMFMCGYEDPDRGGGHQV